MVAKVQILRTDKSNAPPGPLAPGELCVEMAVPLRLWVGVPHELDSSMRKLLADPGNWVVRSGDTMTGFLTLYAQPTQPMHAATKQYVDSAIGGIPPNPDVSDFVHRSGDTMTGALSNTHGFFGPVYLSGNASNCLIWDGGSAAILRASAAAYIQDSAGNNWASFSAGGIWTPLAANIGGTLGVSGVSTQSGINNNGLLNNNGGVNVNHADIAISAGTQPELQDARIWFRDENGNFKGVMYWDRLVDGNPLGVAAMSIYNNAAGAGNQIQLYDNGKCRIAGGVICKDGYTGATFNECFNLNWNGAAGQMGLWVDDIYLGFLTHTSDYRTNRNVAPLPTMWETVKALKPIKYTQADYGPMSAPAKVGEEPKPLFVADDVERWGFVAHELQETLTPSAATGVKDVENAIQSPNPWTVIAALTKALQEAMAEIEALKIHTGMATAKT